MNVPVDETLSRLARLYAGNSQGLGQLVQRDAAMGNPDLIKAIALQRLKSTEQAVQREAAMNNPEQPTVVSQLENELLQRTQQEVAQQATAAAQQKARQQQMGMRRMINFPKEAEFIRDITKQ